MTIRTLIVEDDPMVAEINRRYTESVPGFQVIGIAPSGDAALAAAAGKQPDLITLDVYMPGMSGLEFLARLRAMDLNADAIMATAAGDGEIIRKAMRLGVVDYLIKPYTYDRFVAALRRYAMVRELARAGALDQRSVDTIHLPVAGTPVLSEHPKGVDPRTLGRVCEYLAAQSAGQTVQSIVDATGLSRVTCLRYLSHLLDQGLVGVELGYGGLGRPSKLYRWRGRARATG